MSCVCLFRCQNVRTLLVSMAVCGALVSGAGCARSSSPVQWVLTPSAELTFATLQLDQSIRDSDLAGVLEATDILARLHPTPQPFVEAAAWLLFNKETALARTLLEKAVALMPQDLGLNLLLAETWLEDEQPEKAVRIVQNYAKTYPKSELAQQELGILYLKANLVQEAIRTFEALPAALHTPHLRYYHARALMLAKRPKDAARELTLATRTNPDFMEAWSELARTYELSDQPAKALPAYERLLDNDPNNQDIWLRFINAHLKAGNLKPALEMAHNGPENLGFQLTAATLFLDAGHFEEAEQMLLGLQEEPGAPEEIAFYLAAIAFEHHKNTAGTLSLLESISPGNRFYDRALRFQAQILFEQGQTSKALETIKKAVEAFPSERDFRFMELHLYLSQKHWKNALLSLDSALERWPDDLDLRFSRGSVLDSMGRKDEAMAYMNDIVQNHPTSYQALNYVGYTLAEQGRDLPRALELLHKAVLLAPDKAYVLDSLAWAQFRAGQLNAAWGTIRKAIKLPDGNDASIWEHYGDIAAANHHNEEARRAWNKALSLDPLNPEALHSKLGAL